MGNDANVAGQDQRQAGAKDIQQPPMAHAMRDADPPVLPRPRMPRSQRAKIFVPFDPLKGYREALHEKELEAEIAHYERTHIEDAP